MYIEINKENETKDVVKYRFAISVKVGEKETDTYGQINVLEPKIGYCSFNKNDETFELDKERTDPYFLQEENRTVLKVHMKLLQRKRQNLGYPENLDIMF